MACDWLKGSLHRFLFFFTSIFIYPSFLHILVCFSLLFFLSIFLFFSLFLLISSVFLLFFIFLLSLYSFLFFLLGSTFVLPSFSFISLFVSDPLFLHPRLTITGPTLKSFSLQTTFHQSLFMCSGRFCIIFHLHLCLYSRPSFFNFFHFYSLCYTIIAVSDSFENC